MWGGARGGVGARGLGRRVCEHCACGAAPDEGQATWLSVRSGEAPGQQSDRKGRGCQSCNFTGYAGRIGVYELLELGEYDLPLFRERMAAVKTKRAALERREADLRRSLQEAQCGDPALLAQRIQAVLDAYGTADAAGKNALLKSGLATVWYRKEKKSKPADLQLTFGLRAV